MLLTCNGAFAYGEFHYGALGRTGGMSRPSFGSNAAFLPRNRQAIASRVRQVKRYNAETYAIRNRNNFNFNINSNTGNGNSRMMSSTMASRTTSSTQPSRFNRSYKISTQKSYTKNGITYYN